MTRGAIATDSVLVSLFLWLLDGVLLDLLPVVVTLHLYPISSGRNGAVKPSTASRLEGRSFRLISLLRDGIAELLLFGWRLGISP